MLERRQNARRKTYLGGRVVFNHRRSTMDCILKNIGDQGAKIAFHGPMILADGFDVQVTHLERDVRARVMWRGRNELGVSFVEQKPSVNAPYSTGV